MHIKKEMEKTAEGEILQMEHQTKAPDKDYK